MKIFKKYGFTLAEVLITLTVIGVVAAMTIPTVVKNIGNTVSENQQKVFNTRLVQALNMAKTAGDLARNYNSTEDFLRNGLAKHFKMVAICGAEDIKKCFPYEEIKYMDSNEEKTIKVEDLKTAKSIKVDRAGFEDTAAFISGDGIPVIITYDKNCIVDTEKIDSGISSCVAGVYDLNGAKKPNKYAVTLNDDGKTIKAYTYDIRSFNGASIGELDLFDFEIAVPRFRPQDIYGTKGVGSPTYEYGNDYCAAAENYCEHNNAKLPTKEQLETIMLALCSGASRGENCEFNEAVAGILGINNEAIRIQGGTGDVPCYMGAWPNDNLQNIVCDNDKIDCSDSHFSYAICVK